VAHIQGREFRCHVGPPKYHEAAIAIAIMSSETAAAHKIG